MQLKHIKESIKQRHGNSGNHALRNNHQIITTNKDRERYAKRKYNLFLRDNLNGGGINEDIKKAIKKQWLKKGGDIKTLHKIGYNKALSVLKLIQSN